MMNIGQYLFEQGIGLTDNKNDMVDRYPQYLHIMMDKRKALDVVYALVVQLQAANQDQFEFDLYGLLSQVGE